MPRMHEFGREERLPSYFMNRLQDFLSGARTDLRVTLKDATHVEVIPVEPYGIAAIDLQGLWRFRDTAVSRAHPGGAAGTYTVWAVATKQKVVEAPKPFTDESVYDFDLRITNGANPNGAGVEVFEKIAEVDWDGVAIIALRQTYNAVTGPMLADGAISSAGDLLISRNAVGALVPTLQPNSVGAAELDALSVDTAAIIDLMVTTAKIAAEAITEGKLGGLSVSTAKIVELAVTSAKIAALAVTEAKLAGEAVSAEKIKALAVTTAKLAALAVTTEKIENLAVTSAKIAELAIIEGKIADAAVTSRKFKPSVDLIEASATLACTEAFQDIAGCKLEITPAVASYLLIHAVFDAEVHPNNSPTAASVVGALNVDGVVQARQAFKQVLSPAANTTNRDTIAQNWKIPLTAVKHTIKLQGKKGGPEPVNIFPTATNFLYMLVAQ
ncbi:MAG: hypothetical protein ACRDPE_17145 [Solirubrobacterales bacterium]